MELCLWFLVVLCLLATTNAQSDERVFERSELFSGREVIRTAGEPVHAGNLTAANKDRAWLLPSEASEPSHSRRRILRGRRTWKLGGADGTGSRRMSIVDLTAPSLEFSEFTPPRGAKKTRNAPPHVDPTSCGTPAQCPDFTVCTAGGPGISPSGNARVQRATGGVSLCTNSWLTEWGSQQTDDPQGFWCPISIERHKERHKETERVRDQPGDCAETRGVFGEAACGAGAEAGWRGGVALLENVYVNQHGDVFNATHHFYFGACAPAEETREPSRLFAKFPYGKSTDVMEVEAMVNLQVGPLPQYQFLELVYRLPLLVQLAALLPTLTRFSFFLGEHKVLHSALGRLLGISPWRHVIQPPRDGTLLLLVRRLIQPIHQHCGKPSTTTWNKIRASLRAPRGTPLFSRDWTTRIPPFPPPASVLCPREYPLDWAVVVGVPPASQGVKMRYYENKIPGFSLLDIVSNEFWMDHVVELSAIDARAVDLFRRTVALITAPGAALSAMPFVPRGAFVILLAPHSTPSNVQDPREQKGRVHRAAAVEHHPEVMRAVRGLARAAGLHLAVVACPVESVGSDSDGTPGAPEMVCGTQALADAVSWAASHVYKWQNLPGPGGGPRATGLGDAIPGSGLESKEEVQEWRAWQQCVSTGGSWVRDPYPRSLPWPYPDIFDVGECDAEYLSGDEAMAALAQWRAGNKSVLQDWERIRPGLRYYWSVDFKACRRRGKAVPQHWAWREATHAGFCGLISKERRRLVFVGDSLQDQMVADMLFTMLKDWPRLSPEESAALRYIPANMSAWQTVRPGWLGAMGQWSSYALRVPSCAHMELLFLRNVHLRLAVSSVPAESRWLFTGWATESRAQLERAGMIVMNRGAWFQSMRFFARDLAATCRFLRFTFPDKLIIFRNTAPGHPKCLLHKEPLPQGQDLSRGGWHSWGLFRGENERAKKIVESFGIVYLDVYAQTQYRADGHRGHNRKGRTDCLHYCFPSALDTWVQLLYNTLVQIKI